METHNSDKLDPNRYVVRWARDLGLPVIWQKSNFDTVLSYLSASERPGVTNLLKLRRSLGLEWAGPLVLLGDDLVMGSIEDGLLETIPVDTNVYEWIALRVKTWVPVVHLSGAVPAVKSQPSIVSMVGNLARTAVDVVKTAVQTGQVAAGEALFNERMAVCNVCDKFDKAQTRCTKCGCHMNAKANLLAAKCPLGLWRE